MRQPVMQTPIDSIYLSYGRDLYRITGEEQSEEVMNMLQAEPSGTQQGGITVAADSIDSGATASSSVQATGSATRQGKTLFDNSATGYILGFDPKDGYAKFYIGNTSSYINWDGATLTVVGNVNISQLNIPDSTTANSFHVDTSGNAWWGANVATGYAGANASILATGAATFKSVTLSGSVAISGIANNSSTDISLLGFTHNLAFTSASATQVNWSSGTITLSNGRTFSISSGNTGAMAAATYIYLDTGASVTVLQTTTTYSTAIGANKILVGTAQNNTTAASVVPFGGGQPVLDGAGNIAALSITAASIAASTITAGKLSVSQLSAITADLGSITAGSITINAGVASIDSSGNATFKSIAVGGSSRQYTISDSGIFTFGDGSDGSAAFDGSATPAGSSKSGSDYTLTRDVYYTDATVSTGCTVNPAGYRIFGTGTLTEAGTAVIKRNGNDGANGNAGGAGGAGGAALADGYLKGSAAGGTGGAGATTVANAPAVTAGTSTTNSLGSGGSAGGNGGNVTSTAHAGASGGAGGTATASNVRLIANWHLATLLDIGSTGSTIKFDNSAGAAGGGGGSANESPPNSTGGAGGGGGGSAGGIIAIYFRNIVIGASASITANGGAGGTGGDAGSAAGSGGGGGGGNGGQIILVYNTINNSGSLTANGGAAGAAGPNSRTPGTLPTAGTAGTAGTIRQFQVSL